MKSRIWILTLMLTIAPSLIVSAQVLPLGRVQTRGQVQPASCATCGPTAHGFYDGAVWGTSCPDCQTHPGLFPPLPQPVSDDAAGRTGLRCKTGRGHRTGNDLSIACSADVVFPAAVRTFVSASRLAAGCPVSDASRATRRKCRRSCSLSKQLRRPLTLPTRSETIRTKARDLSQCPTKPLAPVCRDPDYRYLEDERGRRSSADSYGTHGAVRRGSSPRRWSPRSWLPSHWRDQLARRRDIISRGRRRPCGKPAEPS